MGLSAGSDPDPSTAVQRGDRTGVESLELYCWVQGVPPEPVQECQCHPSSPDVLLTESGVQVLPEALPDRHPVVQSLVVRSDKDILSRRHSTVYPETPPQVRLESQK